jgi:hypothetical protein
VEAIPTLEEKIFKIQHLDIEPQFELMGEEIKIAEQNVDIKLLVSV